MSYAKKLIEAVGPGSDVGSGSDDDMWKLLADVLVQTTVDPRDVKGVRYVKTSKGVTILTWDLQSGVNNDDLEAAGTTADEFVKWLESKGAQKYKKPKRTKHFVQYD